MTDQTDHEANWRRRADIKQRLLVGARSFSRQDVVALMALTECQAGRDPS